MESGGIYSGSPPSTLHRCWVGRRDESNLAVENAYQLVEVFRATSVTGRFEEFAIRPHVTLDVDARFRQQRSQHFSGRILMVAALRRSSAPTECLFEECDADSFRAAHILECGGLP